MENRSDPERVADPGIRHLTLEIHGKVVTVSEMPKKLPGHYYFETETFYDQLDGQMILHHPRYFVFVERAQQAWMEEILDAPRFDWRNFPDMYLVVRKLEAEYLLPIEGVREIVVVLWPERVRAAKLEMGFEIRSPDLEILYCQGKRVNCKVDRESHQPVIWSDLFLHEAANQIAKVNLAKNF